jgi:hypothetical protein
MADDRGGETEGRNRKKNVRLIRAIAAIVVFAFVGCATSQSSRAIDQAMASWMGNSVSDLIASWGPPDQETQVEDGSRVLTYNRVLWEESDPLSCDNLYPTSDPNQADAECARRLLNQRAVRGLQMFWANRDGVIYRWAWRTI